MKWICIIVILLNSLFCGKLKQESKIVNWTYPSDLPRDPDLIGEWYGLYYDEQGKWTGGKYIYHPDGKTSVYDYDTAKKDFGTTNYGISDGIQTLYWSAKNGVKKTYSLIRWWDEPNEPSVGSLNYYLSVTKDSFYYVDMNSSKLYMVRKIPVP